MQKKSGFGQKLEMFGSACPVWNCRRRLPGVHERGQSPAVHQVRRVPEATVPTPITTQYRAVHVCILLLPPDMPMPDKDPSSSSTSMAQQMKKKRVDDQQPSADAGQRPVQLQRRRVWRACESCRCVSNSQHETARRVEFTTKIFRTGARRLNATVQSPYVPNARPQGFNVLGFRPRIEQR